MSHHHHHYREPEKNELKAPESTSKPILPMFEKTDLSILSIIKQFLSPTGQKIVDLLISISGGNDLNDIPLDIPGLISQLNIKGENNPLPELITSLMNAMAGENKGALNPVLLNALMTMSNRKKEN
jgi:hypothetical protein